MVREVRFSCHATDRLEPPVCRDSVLDDDRSSAGRARAAEKSRPTKRSRKGPRPKAARPNPPAAAPSQAASAPSASPPSAAATTERRHLAGADWLSGYVPLVRKAR